MLAQRYWDELITQEKKIDIQNQISEIKADLNFNSQSNSAKMQMIRHFSNNNPPIKLISFVCGLDTKLFLDLDLYVRNEQNKRDYINYINPTFLKNLMLKNTIVQFGLSLKEFIIGHVISLFNDKDGKKYYFDSNYDIGPLCFESEEELFNLLNFSNKIFRSGASQRCSNKNVDDLAMSFTLSITGYLPDQNQRNEDFEKLRIDIRNYLRIEN